MAEFPQLILGLALAVPLFFFFRWLIIDTEGVFLGRRVVVWLYDVTAHRYDRIKDYDYEDETHLVTQPVLAALRGARDPLVLDVATGTGRVPYNLLHDEAFDGSIIGLDASRQMLAIAEEKLSPSGDRAAFCRGAAGALPFPGNVFDAVTCLEALEFFPSDEAALREMARVLRPGGALLVTRRRGREGKAFLGRYRDQATFEALVEHVGLDQPQSRRWEVNYDLVLARKPSLRTGSPLRTASPI